METQDVHNEDSSVPNEVVAGVDESGVTQTAEGATSGGEQEHEADAEQGGQEQQQSKSQNSKQRARRKLRESETRNAQLAEDNRKLAERLGTLETQVDGVVNPPKERPSRVNYESEEDYEDSLFEWRDDATQRQSSPVQAQQVSTQPVAPQAPQSRVSKEAIDSWHDDCDTVADKYADFDEVINNKALPVSGIMADTMVETKNGAEVAYHLGKNPVEAQRIAGLSPVQQMMEIQKLAENFTTSITTAPDPITPTAGQDSFAGKDPEKMSPEEYRDFRRAQGMPH